MPLAIEPSTGTARGAAPAPASKSSRARRVAAAQPALNRPKAAGVRAAKKPVAAARKSPKKLPTTPARTPPPSAAPQAKRATRGGAAKTDGLPKAERAKLMRDSFTMPKVDFEMIATLKKRALAAGQEVKKSELLRAGLHALAALDEAAFASTVAAVPRLKTGRPRQKKSK